MVSVEQQGIEVPDGAGDFYEIGHPLTRQRDAASGPVGRQL
jgi:hypothetical protein